MEDQITAQLTKVFGEILYGFGTLIGITLGIIFVLAIVIVVYLLMNRDRGV